MFSTRRVIVGPDEYRIEVTLNEELRTEVSVATFSTSVEKEAKLRATEDYLKRQILSKLKGGETPVVNVPVKSK